MTMTSTNIILARRFGYGPAGLPAPVTTGTLLSSITAPDDMARQYPLPGGREVLMAGQRFVDARKAAGKTKKAPPEVRAARIEVTGLQQRGVRGLMMRIVESQTPFVERLTWFWADHFTATAHGGITPALPVSFIEEAIRPHIGGRFSDMLQAAETHPAMLDFLDQNRSVGPASPLGMKANRGLNENLAREILELHTIGPDGGYSQEDVRQFAELLTGLTFTRRDGMVFRRQWAEPGAETVLGQSYGGGKADLGDITSMLDDLAARPETARYIAGKLAVHFISDTPPPDLVDSMAAAYGTTGQLTDVYAAMLAHPAATSPDFTKVRQPLDFIGAGLRALRQSGADIETAGMKKLRGTVLSPLQLMGQPLLSAPGPDGWPENRDSWLTPQGVAQRIFWGLRVPQMHLKTLPEPAEFAGIALGELEPDVELAIRRAETRAESIGLIIASPAFNRR